MAGAYTSRLVPESFEIVSDSIADGNYDYPLSDDRNPRPNNILEYFYFVDANGVPVVATAGDVTVVASPDSAVTFHTLANGTFKAVDCLAPERTKPSGRGRATHVRVALSGITAAGATGFKFMLSQG